MDETNDTGNSSESSQQNSGASTTREQPRTARRPRLEINMIQYPRADTNKRELFPVMFKPANNPSIKSV